MSSYIHTLKLISLSPVLSFLLSSPSFPSHTLKLISLSPVLSFCSHPPHFPHPLPNPLSSLASYTCSFLLLQRAQERTWVRGSLLCVPALFPHPHSFIHPSPSLIFPPRMLLMTKIHLGVKEEVSGGNCDPFSVGY